MKRQYLVVELRRPEQLRAAQQEIGRLRAELADLRQRYDDLQVRYGFEGHLNNELCDLCRAAGISFRPALERARRRNWR